MLRVLRRPLKTCMQSGSSTSPRSRSSSTRAHLPRLPVPDLHKTLQRYTESLEPFLKEDEARGGPKAEDALAVRMRWAEDFENGIGQLCQDRLQGLSFSISARMRSECNYRSTRQGISKQLAR